VNAKATVRRLLSKGVPEHKMVHIIGEQQALASTTMDKTQVRITDYEPDDKTQLLIGTIQVLSRISMNKNTEMSLYQKPPLLVIVKFTYMYKFMISLTIQS
jgi:hypothetical protein